MGTKPIRSMFTEIVYSGSGVVITRGVKGPSGPTVSQTWARIPLPTWSPYTPF